MNPHTHPIKPEISSLLNCLFPDVERVISHVTEKLSFYLEKRRLVRKINRAVESYEPDNPNTWDYQGLISLMEKTKEFNKRYKRYGSPIPVEEIWGLIYIKETEEENTHF